MADRGRDLKIGILSDVSKFDLDRPARDLEDMGRAATDAGKDLSRLDDDVKRLDLDQVGDDAKTTARKMDNAFDAIRQSSKATARTVDNDADKMGHSLKDAGEEAAGTARETAASFSGSIEDITGGIQEMAANAFGSFGPLGAAAGLAAAAGLGLITSTLAAAKERVKELTKAFTELKLEGGSFGDVIQVVLDDLKENDELVQLSKDAKMLGVDWQTLIRAMAGSDPDIRAVNAQLDRLSTTQAGMHVTGNQANTAFNNLGSAVGRAGTALKDSTAEARAYADGQAAIAAATTGATGDIRTQTGATQAQIDTEADYRASMEATRTAIESVGDAAVDAAVKEADSIDDIIDAQSKAIRAQRDFAENTRAVLREVGQDGVDWANQFGENAPKAMQMLADAPKDKQAEIIHQYQESGRLAAASTADGITKGRPAVVSAAQRAHEAAARELGVGVPIPATVVAPTARQLATIRQGIQQGIGTVTVVPNIVLPEQQFWRTRP